MGKGEIEDRYTQDGTTDLKGNPCVKKETGTWKACPYILGNECCERLAYYGMSTNLVMYMVGRMGEGVATAANNVTNWAGTCYITPLIGAFLADSYLGRYWTISIFMMVYVLVSPFIKELQYGLKSYCFGYSADCLYSYQAIITARGFILCMCSGLYQY